MKPAETLGPAQDEPATTDVYVQPRKYHVNIFSEAFGDTLFSEDSNKNLFSEDYHKNLFSEEDNGNLLRRGVNHGLEGELSSCLPSLARKRSLSYRSWTKWNQTYIGH